MPFSLDDLREFNRFIQVDRAAAQIDGERNIRAEPADDIQPNITGRFNRYREILSRQVFPAADNDVRGASAQDICDFIRSALYIVNPFDVDGGEEMRRNNHYILSNAITTVTRALRDDAELRDNVVELFNQQEDVLDEVQDVVAEEGDEAFVHPLSFAAFTNSLRDLVGLEDDQWDTRIDARYRPVAIVAVNNAIAILGIHDRNGDNIAMGDLARFRRGILFNALVGNQRRFEGANQGRLHGMESVTNAEARLAAGVMVVLPGGGGGAPPPPPPPSVGGGGDSSQLSNPSNQTRQ
jgi:hypothetical protein